MTTILERAARALAEADARGRANLYDANPDLYQRLARAVLIAVRDEVHELHLVGDEAMRDGHEADGVLIAMIDAVLNETGVVNRVAPLARVERRTAPSDWPDDKSMTPKDIIAAGDFAARSD